MRDGIKETKKKGAKWWLEGQTETRYRLCHHQDDVNDVAPIATQCNPPSQLAMTTAYPDYPRCGSCLVQAEHSDTYNSMCCVSTHCV